MSKSQLMKIKTYQAVSLFAACLLIFSVTALCSHGVEPLELVPQYTHAIPTLEYSFSHTGQLAVSNKEGLVDIWDTKTHTLIRTITTPELLVEYSTCVISLSPDGRTLAHANANGTVQLWNVVTGHLGKTLPEPVGRPDGLVWTPNGEFIAAGGSIVRLWDVVTGKALRTFPASGDITFSSDGKLIATVSHRNAKLFDTTTGNLIWTFSDKSGLLPPIAISPDKTLLATGGEDPDWNPGFLGPLESENLHHLKIKVWSIRTGKLIRMLPGPSNEGGPGHLQFLQDNRSLFTTGSANNAFWDVKTGKKKRSLHESGLLSPDGKQLASGFYSVTLINTTTAKTVFQALPHPNSVEAVAFSPDGQMLAAGYGGRYGSGLWLWNLGKTALSRALQAPPSDLHDVRFLPEGRVMSNGYGEALIWKVSNGKLILTRSGPTVKSDSGLEQKWSLLSPDASLMLNESGGPFKQSFEVRDAQTKKLLRSIPIGRGTIHGSAFSPDGHYLAAQIMNVPSLRVFDLTTGNLVSTLQDAESALPLVFSPDGATIAGSLYRGIALWDRDSGRQLLRIPAATDLTARYPYAWGWEQGRTASLAFAPDGKTIAAGLLGEVRIYDTTTGTELGRFQSGGDVFRCVTFSPDGARIAAGNEAGQVCIWDVNSRRLLVTMVGIPSPHQGKITSDWYAYTPNGRYDWSPGAEKYLRWNRNGRILPTSAVATALRRHNLLKVE